MPPPQEPIPALGPRASGRSFVPLREGKICRPPQKKLTFGLTLLWLQTSHMVPTHFSMLVLRSCVYIGYQQQTIS